MKRYPCHLHRVQALKPGEVYSNTLPFGSCLPLNLYLSTLRITCPFSICSAVYEMQAGEHGIGVTMHSA